MNELNERTACVQVCSTRVLKILFFLFIVLTYFYYIFPLKMSLIVTTSQLFEYDLDNNIKAKMGINRALDGNLFAGLSTCSNKKK